MNLQEAIEYLKHANFTTEAKVPMLALAEAVEKQQKAGKLLAKVVADIAKREDELFGRVEAIEKQLEKAKK